MKAMKMVEWLDASLETRNLSFLNWNLFLFFQISSIPSRLPFLFQNPLPSVLWMFLAFSMFSVFSVFSVF